jgi:hypothetical protein
MNEIWKKVRESTDIAWIKEWRDKSDPTSPNWHVAQERLIELMLKQKPWYHTGIGWIALLTLLAAIAALAVALWR